MKASKHRTYGSCGEGCASFCAGGTLWPCLAFVLVRTHDGGGYTVKVSSVLERWYTYITCDSNRLKSSNAALVVWSWAEENERERERGEMISA